MRSHLILVVIGIVAFGLVSAASATVTFKNIAGSNPLLSGDGTIYIPDQSGTSGALGGSYLGGGGTAAGKVGLSAEKVYYAGKGATKTGFVTYQLVFDFADTYLDYQNGANVLIKAYDLDCLQELQNGLQNRETAQFTLVRIGGTPRSFTLDDTTYRALGTWADPNKIGQTGDANVTYKLDLKQQFGMDQSDFDFLNNQHQLVLQVSLRTFTEKTTPGAAWYVNTPESLTGQLQAGFSDVPPVPEPTTMIVLAISAIGLLRRRRRQNAIIGQ